MLLGSARRAGLRAALAVLTSYGCVDVVPTLAVVKLPRLTAVPADSSSGHTRPAKRSSAAVLRVRLAVVLAVLLFSSAAGVFSACAWLLAPGRGSSTTVDATPVPQARAEAELVLRSLLRAEPFTVPLADGVGNDPTGQQAAAPAVLNGYAWSGFDVEELVSSKKRSVFEIHRFVVSSTDPPGLFDAFVTLSLTPSGPVLATYPSLMPTRSPSVDGTRVDYSEFDKAPVSGPVQARVVEWLSAFAADTGTDLFAFSGDNTAGVYRGLGGFTAHDGTILSSVNHSGGEFLVVRAGVRLVSANGYAMYNELDLLIGSHTTPRPYVVAWGPAGSGNGLRPYVNAVR